MSERSWAGSSPEARPRAAAVVVAGGSGRRLGAAVPKQYLELLGEPILLRSVRAFLAHPGIDWTVVVLPAADAEDPPAWLRRLEVRVVAGGAERGDSVWNGLQATPPEAELVLVHDGARPFVPAEVIDRVLAGAAAGGAIAALPAADTLKEVGADGVIRATPERSRLWQAQTPQGFPRAVLLEAYRRAREAGYAGTDEASLCERLGVPVRVVPGSPLNLKITHAADLDLAAALAQRLR